MDFVADRKLRYSIGVDVDTKQLLTQIDQAVKSLQKLGASPKNQLSQELKSGAAAALELSTNLQRAVNQETGKLDLTAFNNSLRHGLGSITEYYAKIEKLGPAGKAAFSQMASAITRAELPLRRSSKLLDSLWVTMKNTMRWQLTSSVMHGFIGGIQKAYGYARDLNDSLNSIQIVTGKNSEEMARFAKQANEAAKALSTTTTNYTDASLIYYQQGLDNKEVKGRTDATVKYANVADISAETASEQLTAIWNNFYDGSKSLEYYIDVMTKLGATTASSSSEISAGLQKFAAVAETVGLSYEYAASALATVTATTRESADIVGTAFRTLFARIQGLNLGETLEDGTDLNKYSKALDTVGIKIKDTSGEMKSMNQILDELGEKWNTLSKDSQLALAQTVAGVRQYTHLIALMDNWDFFQKNLSTALGSEGTLEQQAEIYASSWEAARDRVKASAQDIYDSLINPNFYIGIDDTLGPILDRIADFIDGIGGMSGVLMLIASLMTKIYGEKMAQSLRNMAINLGIVTKQEQERARKLQEQTALLAERASLLNIDNNVGKQGIQILQEEVRLRGLINSNLDGLSARQQQNLQFEQQRLQALKDYAAEMNATAAHHQENADNRAEAILYNIKLNPDWQTQLKSQLLEVNKMLTNNFSDMSKVISLSTIGRDASSVIMDINSQLDALAQKRAGVEMLTTAFQSIGTEGGLTEQQVRELAVQLDLLTSEEVKSTVSSAEFADKIKQLGITAETAKQQTKALADMLKTMGANPVMVQKYVSSLDALYNSLSQGKITLGEFRNGVRQLEQDLQAGKFATRDWAEQLMYLSRIVSSVAMAGRGMSGLLNILDNDDLSEVEKFTQGLSSIAFILPSIISLVQKARAEFKLATLQNAYYTASTKAAAAGAGKLSASIAGVGAAAKTAFPLIGLIATAVIMVAQVISHNIKKNEEYIQSLHDMAYEAADSSEKQIESNRELLKEMSSALDIYEETQENKSELDDAARALADAFNIEGDALAKLSGKYEDYNKVLQKAIEENKKVLEQQLSDVQDAKRHTEEEIFETLSDDSTRDAILKSWKFTFDGWFANEGEAAEILANKLKDAFGDNAVTSGSGIGASTDLFLPSDADLDDFIKFYNTLKDARKEIEGIYSTQEMGDSGLVQDIDKRINALKDLIDQYNTYEETIVKVKLQLGDGLGIDGEDIQSLQEYIEWASQAKQILTDLYPDKNDNEIDTIITDIVNSFANPDISGLKQTYDAIQDILDLISDNSDIDENFLMDIFSSEKYDINALSSSLMNWSSVTKANFEEAYKSAKDYTDALQGVSDAQLQLEGAKQALETFGEGNLKSKDIVKIQGYIDWGNAEKGTKDFTDWLNSEVWEQQAYLNKLISDSYQEIIDSATKIVDKSKDTIEKNQKIINDVTEEELQDAYNIVNAYKDAERMFKDWQNAVSEGLEFDPSNYNIDWSKIAGADNFDEFKDNVGQNIEEAIEEGTRDAELLINKVEVAEEGIEQAQKDLDEANFTIEVTAKDRFSYQIDQIKNSANNLISVFEAIEDGVTISTDSMGNKFWAFSVEAVEAIEAIYPGFAANAKLLEDGTFTLTDSMYKAFFDSSNGQLAADADAKTAMLDNGIAMLKAKRTQAEQALEIAQALSTGELTIDSLTEEQKEVLLNTYKDACALNNGDILADEVNTLTTSNTNWNKLWTQVSGYARDGAKNMALNVSNGTKSVLQNLEKIRSAAYKAGQQIASIGEDGAKDQGKIDVSVASWAGGGNTSISTKDGNSFLSSIKSAVISTDAYNQRKNEVGRDGADVISQAVGDALSQIYEDEISGLDAAIGAFQIAKGKLLSSISKAYSSTKKALDTENKNSKKDNKENKSKSKDQKDFDEEAEKYHEINRQLEYYDYLINKIDDDISNATTVDEKLELEAQKVELLNEKYESLNAKRKEAYDYISGGITDIQCKFGSIFAAGGLTIKFDETGEIANFEELERYLIEQVRAATSTRNNWVANTYNKASAEAQEGLEDTLKNYDNAVEAAETILDAFRDSIGNYEGDIDTYRGSLEELQSVIVALTESERQRYELNLEKLKELEDKFYSTEREDAHFDSRRNLFGNKIDIGGTQERLRELFGADADIIQQQAINAQETYSQAWDNIWTIRKKIIEYWPDVKIDTTTGEITNYYEVLEIVRKKAKEASDAVNNFRDTHNTDNLTASEQAVYDGLIATKKTSDVKVGQFENFASEYENAMDTMIDAQEGFSDALLEMLDNAEQAFNAILEKLEQMEDRFYRINRLIAWDDFESSLLDDAYELANSDVKRAEILEQQISGLEKKATHLEESIAISRRNIAALQKFGKETYGMAFDENNEILSVQIQGKIVGIENTDVIHDYVEELENEFGEWSLIGKRRKYTNEEQARVDWLKDEIVKWKELLPWAQDYASTLDDLLDSSKELSHIPVEIKGKEEDLHELQKKKNTEQIEDLDTISDRYHEINRQIERQERLLNKISTASDRAFGIAKLRNYTDELEGLNNQLDNLISKFEENKDYLQADYNALFKFGTPKIDQNTGELLNRDELIGPAQKAYEDYYYNTYLPSVTSLNNRIKAGEEITDDEMTQYEDLVNELDILKKAYEDVTNAADQYEDSIDTREDIIEEWQDTIREIEDTKLKEITYKLDVIIQVKDMKRAADEFSKTIVESFGDAITHGLAAADWSAAMDKDEAALLPSYLQEYNELKDYVANAVGFIDEDGNYKYATDVQGAIDKLEELQGKIISSGKYLLDWIENLENLVPEAVNAAAERLAQFTNQLEHNNSILNTIEELYTLQGVTYKTMEGYNRLQKVGQERYDTQLAQAEISKKWFDDISRELTEAQAKLDEASEGTLEYDALKANRDALLEQYNEAQEAYLIKAQEAMTTAHDIYMRALEKSSYDFSQAISGGIGLDLLQDKYDNYINEEERYLDTVNELYQVNSWNLKLQTAIDDASTSAQKDRLKALKDEIDLRRQGGKLSQYDLDILEAKYNLQLAQMALEDAQNAKNQARLVRDSQGNWNYQFYADDTQIQDAQQQFLDAQNEYYNIAKQQVKDVTAEILQAWQECNNKIKEIYADESLTVEEREAAIAEVRRHYAEIIKGLEEEKNIAIGDMNTAALQSILYMTQTGTASIIDMKGNSIPVIQEMSDETQRIITEMEEQTGIKFDDMTKQAIALLIQMGLDSNTILSGLRIDANGHITGMSDDIKLALAEMVNTSAEQEDTWSNDFANTLDDMTVKTDQFDELLDTYINNMEDSWTNYEDKVQNVANSAGTSIDELDDVTNQLSDSTDRFSDAGLNAANVLLDQVSAAQDASWAYLDLATSIMETVGALEELSRAQVEVGQNWSEGTDVGNESFTLPWEDLDIIDSPAGIIGSTTTNTVNIPGVGIVSVGSDGVVKDSSGNPIKADNFDVDWSDLMTQSVIKGDMDTADILGLIRDTSDHWKLEGHETWRNNAQVIADAIKARDDGTGYQGYEGPFQNNEMTFEEWMHRLGIPGYSTGGYTGDFDNGKLAFLHEKELVLNQQDTQNILAAVTAVRSLGPELFSQIERILDGNAVNAMAMLTSKIATVQQQISAGTIEQSVKIEASFPSVTDRNEIEEAFNSLVNDAAQYARRRKE